MIGAIVLLVSKYFDFAGGGLDGSVHEGTSQSGDCEKT